MKTKATIDWRNKPSSARALATAFAVPLALSILGTSCPPSTCDINSPPEAAAGDDQTVAPGDTVVLDGSASSDLNNDALSYQWEQRRGPVDVTLTTADEPVATFIPTIEGVYAFRLTVRDGCEGFGPGSQDEVLVEVRLTCGSDADCDDGVFCNGPEICVGGTCVPGDEPCGAGETCNESEASCRRLNSVCVRDSDCDDGAFCNGSERCASARCVPGTSPCASGVTCDETNNRCAATGCRDATDCDDGNVCTDDACDAISGQCVHANTIAPCSDGLFCTASDRCSGGICVGGPSPCLTGQVCDETGQRCVACLNDGDCNDGNAQTTDTCQAGTCVHGSTCVELSGTISQDRILDAGCYRVTSDLRVNARLTIMPGATLTFEENAGVVIAQTGSLTALGTASQPILLTGAQPVRGFWKGVWFSGSLSFNNQLDFVTVEYAGGAGWRASLGIDTPYAGSSAKSRAAISNSTIRESKTYGFLIYSGCEVPTFTNNAIRNNTGGTGWVASDAVKYLHPSSKYEGDNVVSGRIDVEQIYPDTMTGIHGWTAIGATHRILSDIKVMGDLTVSGGVTLVFDENKGLVIGQDGSLLAVGTADRRVVFTGAQAVRGFWKGVWFSGSLSFNNRLDYVTVEYAGGAGWRASLGIDTPYAGSSAKSRAAISNSTIRESKTYGFWIYSGCEVPTFTNNTIRNNTGGTGWVASDAVKYLHPSSKYEGDNVARGTVYVEQIYPDTMTGAQTWIASTADLRVRNDIRVQGSLTIQPPTVLIFEENTRFSIEKGGKLTATGVTFKGLQPTPGYWKGLWFNSATTGNNLTLCVVDGGGGGNPSANIVLHADFAGRPSVSIGTSSIINSAGWGVWGDAGSVLSDFTASYGPGNRLGAQHCYTPERFPFPPQPSHTCVENP